MDPERAVITSALQSGDISALAARGIESKHFNNTESGKECAKIYDWAASHTRRYGATPSISLVKANFPNWRGEPAVDPLEALADEFLAEVKRRHFEAKVFELAEVAKEFKTGKRDQRYRLDEVMLDAARDLISIIPSSQVSYARAEMQERIDQYEIEKAEGRIAGIKMGIPLFDDLTDGFQQGDVATVAGFSGRGKSTLALYLLSNALNQEKNTLLLSLEMSRKQILERYDTMITNFSHKLLRKRELPTDELSHWREAAKKAENAKSDLVVADKLGACTVDRVYAEISRYKPDVTCVDYVQLMKGSKGSLAKWEGLVEITNELKAIALSTDSTIIMVSQDQRSAAESGSTESNMGGSVSVLQAADIYMGMHQDDAMREQKRLALRLLKNRNGPPAETDILCDPEFMRFEPWNEPQQFTKASVPA